MAAAQPSAAPTPPSASDRSARDEHAPPDPLARATQHIEESRRLLAEAQRALQSGSELARTSELVGLASNRIGSALHFLRLSQRR